MWAHISRNFGKFVFIFFFHRFFFYYIYYIGLSRYAIADDKIKCFLSLYLFPSAIVYFIYENNKKKQQEYPW